jgi:uncharacterized membrane protein YhaH (DUF805 family)
MALIIPSLALTVRRLHDSGRSGAYIFVAFIPFVGPIYLFVLLLLKGEKKENKYGEQAKEVSFGIPSAKALIGLAVFWIIVAIGSIFGWSQIKGNFSLTPHIFIGLLIPISVLIIGVFFNKSADTRNPGIALAISSAIILIYSLANLLRSSIMEDISRSPWLFSLPMLTLLSEFALIWLAVLWINKKKSYHAPIVALAIIETTICFLHASMPLYTSMIQSEINRLFFIATIIETLIVSFMYFLLAVFLLPAKKKEAPSSAAAS